MRHVCRVHIECEDARCLLLLFFGTDKGGVCVCHGFVFLSVGIVSFAQRRVGEIFDAAFFFLLLLCLLRGWRGWIHFARGTRVAGGASAHKSARHGGGTSSMSRAMLMDTFVNVLAAIGTEVAWVAITSTRGTGTIGIRHTRPVARADFTSMVEVGSIVLAPVVGGGVSSQRGGGGGQHGRRGDQHVEEHERLGDHTCGVCFVEGLLVVFSPESESERKKVGKAKRADINFRFLNQQPILNQSFHQISKGFVELVHYSQTQSLC